MLNLIFLSIVISATIDSTNLFIGDQTDLHLQATYNTGEQVSLPVIGDHLIAEIEVVDRTIADTITLSDGKKQINQYLTLTCFHDSLYYIAPLPFTVGSDTLWSPSMTLNVIQPFEVDTADLAITDIKAIAKAPVWWWGIIRWILLALAVIGLGVGIFFLVRRIQVKKGIIAPVTKQEPARPAEEVALEKLDAIREQKIWQAGQVKEYHTQLTDVVREYIASRYDVHSTEKTSDETLREVKPILNDKRELYEQLRKMLSLADLVKFAKWTTTGDENEASLTTAYTFVHETTPMPEADATTDTDTTH